MQQVKFFIGLETDRDALEKEINDWLAASNAKVLQLTANIAPQTQRGGPGGLGKTYGSSDLFVSVLYETG